LGRIYELTQQIIEQTHQIFGIMQKAFGQAYGQIPVFGQTHLVLATVYEQVSKIFWESNQAFV
jgi:hypothetical protein